MTLHEIERRVLNKTLANMRIGWFDFSSDSYDQRVIRAKALRLWYRLQGRRITIRQSFEI
jgi:hypothetical protein